MNQIETALSIISTPVYALIFALAVYSITRLISVDSFPPIERARNWFYDRFPYDGYVTEKRPKRGTFVVVGRNYHVNVGTWAGELISCPWCLGWWVSLGMSLSFLFWPMMTLAVCFPFAFRVIPGIISRYVH
jgi:Protein of unknown function (DUF1360)